MSYLFEDVSFGYNESKQLFDHISILIPEDKIGLMGRNGVGKTTLLKIMKGDLPYSGTISLQGRMYECPLSFRRYERFTPNELLEMALCLKDFSKKDYTASVELLYLEEYMNQALGELSKGTQKKIGILMSLLSTKEILFFDEPFESIDQPSNDNVIEFLKQSQKRYIIVSHEKEYLRAVTQKVYLLENGMLHATP